jgi:hypothetical protein
MNKNQFQILQNTGKTFNVPLFLEADLDEMGVMVEFDGEMEQIEQLCNFTYSGNGNAITVYNTGSTNRLKKLVDAEFTVDWGDGVLLTGFTLLSSTSHTYTSSGEKTITITMDSPWGVQEVEKTIQVPLVSGYTGTNALGTLTFDVPYTSITGKTQNYLNDYDYNQIGYTGSTTGTTKFAGIGPSRVDELKLYGSGNSYSGLTYSGMTIDGEYYLYTGYTLDCLEYKDMSDGVTYISGDIQFLYSSGCTSDYAIETITNAMLTRNEHFLGFIDDPVIYSDIFVERGKQGVCEYNLRLGEVDSLGELEVYGNGFFTVRKQ